MLDRGRQGEIILTGTKTQPLLIFEKICPKQAKSRDVCKDRATYRLRGLRQIRGRPANSPTMQRPGPLADPGKKQVPIVGKPFQLVLQHRFRYDLDMKYFCPILLWLFFAVATATAQTPVAPAAIFGFDCWVGIDVNRFATNYIRCMADRDLPYQHLPDPKSDAVMDILHTELHGRSGADAERLYKANIELIRESRSVWNIVIHSYPYEWSWQEGLPEQLVRAVLCPRDGTCRVLVTRH